MTPRTDMTMAESFLVNVQDRPDINKPGPDGKRFVPGAGTITHIATQVGTTTRFLGRAEDGSQGPWVYYKEQKKGDVVPFHRHAQNRTEFLIEGSIEWREKDKAPKVYGAGTLSYVEAGVLYGYEVLEDAKILILFEGPPGFNPRA